VLIGLTIFVLNFKNKKVDEMEDNISDIILFAILMLFFACVVNMFDDSIDYSLKPLSEQKDDLFNKWRRIY
jgi:hypothetical protein